jgi:hypothetical protein
MGKRVLLLRISYWVGIIADGLATLRMLFPKIGSVPEYRYALGLGASLMFGWTLLLIWADRKPTERKGVLLLTAFPVCTGLLLAEIYAVISGVITFNKMLPTAIFLIVLIILFSVSFFYARSVDNKSI